MNVKQVGITCVAEEDGVFASHLDHEYINIKAENCIVHALAPPGLQRNIQTQIAFILSRRIRVWFEATRRTDLTHLIQSFGYKFEAPDGEISESGTCA